MIIINNETIKKVLIFLSVFLLLILILFKETNNEISNNKTNNNNSNNKTNNNEISNSNFNNKESFENNKVNENNYIMNNKSIIISMNNNLTKEECLNKINGKDINGATYNLKSGQCKLYFTAEKGDVNNNYESQIFSN